MMLQTGTYSYREIHPNGPANTSVDRMSVAGSKLWVTSGGFDGAGNNEWLRNGIYSYIDDNWQTYKLDSVADVYAVIVDPSDPNKVDIGSWGWGLVELANSQVTNVYGLSNSSLVASTTVGTKYKWIGISGFAFDNDHNLWMTNSNTGNTFSVKKTDGTWRTFPINNSLNPIEIGDMVIDDFGQKWTTFPHNSPGDYGILVFSDNNTIDNPADDQYKFLNTAVGNGALPSITVLSIAKDLDGNIWVGTDKGIAVFYSPGNVFTNNNFDSQQILVELGGYAQYLLETESVSAIAIDGANRKWMGTQNSGVFLMSADGTQQLLQFNTDNSPLASNEISSITIDQQTGEVFFGTSEGIFSYKHTATEGGEQFSGVYAYPNPVKDTYHGPIAVKGLAKNSDVKITDVSGTVIFSTKAMGGQAVWDGNNFNGQRAQSGVYLVFCANDDGSQTIVTKILFLN